MGNKNASLQHFRIHDLRVTCETRLANLGFNQEIRDAVHGHARPGLQKIYNKHDYLKEKREALRERRAREGEPGNDGVEPAELATISRSGDSASDTSRRAQ